jgi:hypothetical protein
VTDTPRHNWAATLSLFSSAGTLVCCALPAVVVTLAGGAALISLTTALPQLIWLSEHKTALFGIGFVLLALGGWLQWRNRNAPCPIDPAQAAACTRLRRINAWIYGVSVALFVTGFSFAFVLPRLLAD